MPNGGTPEIIQSEAQAMRAKQDRRLQGLLRIAAGALIAFLSIGTIAVAASDDLASATAVVVFGVAAVLGIVLVAIEAIVAYRWKEGPDIAKLLRVYRRRRPSEPSLRIGLVVALRKDYDNNDRALRTVRGLVLLQAVIAFGGLIVLLLGLLELV